MHLGDFDAGDTIHLKFTTVNSSGVPTQLAGTPAISIYKDGSATQDTDGVTLTVDFDSVTGLNHVAIDTSADGTFYANGSDFQVVITTGTVSGSSVVGYVVASFSLRNRAALYPTTAGRTLDVSAGGEAGVDWANVGSPTTTVNLSATTVKTATDVETDTQDIQGRLPAALTAGGNIKADALAISGDATAADNCEAFFDGTGYAGTNNVIPTVTTVVNVTTVNGLAANVITAASIAADAVTEIQAGLGTAAGVWDLSDGIETGLTPRQCLRLVVAVLAGKASGGGTTTVAYRNAVADAKARVTMTVDSSGNRSAVATDLT